MKITIYGYGYVGKAVARFLENHYALQTVDPNALSGGTFCKAGPDPDYSTVEWEETDFAIICAPTPEAADGSCDYSAVEAIVKEGRHRHYLVKSTIPPGTTERLGANVVFSPEYIGEGAYHVPWWKDYAHPTDMTKHTFHIFGGRGAETRLWVDIWQKVAGWVPAYSQTDSRTAELVKYAENMFLATKKVFCSELYAVAEALGVDYRQLRELWLLDKRIGPAMTLVFPEKMAYGGKCLPKDTRAIVKAAADYGHDAKLFRAVIDRNAEFAEQDK